MSSVSRLERLVCIIYKDGKGEIAQEQVSFRIPKGWQGGTPEQFLNSAEAVLAQGPDSLDSRREAAKWVIRKFGKKSQKQIK